MANSTIFLQIRYPVIHLMKKWYYEQFDKDEQNS